MLKGCPELLVLLDPTVLLVKKAIVDEKGPLVFKVFLETKVNEASMGRVVSEEKSAYKCTGCSSANSTSETVWLENVLCQVPCIRRLVEHC